MSLMTGAWLGTERDRRNRFAILRWSILLAVSVVGSAFMLRMGGSAALKWVIAAIPIGLLIPWLLSYLRFIREADELVRQIQLEGLAVGFCAGFAFGIIDSVLGHAGLPQLDAASSLSVMVAIMALGYAFGRVLASKRFR